jgi:hypothetical protein
MKVTITSPVRHNGVDLEVGETADLAKKPALALLDVGSAALPEDSSGTASTPTPAPAPTPATTPTSTPAPAPESEQVTDPAPVTSEDGTGADSGTAQTQQPDE